MPPKPEHPAHHANDDKTAVALPIDGLDDKKDGGGPWNLQKRVDFRLSGLDTFRGDRVLRVFYSKNSGTSRDPGVGGMGIDSVPRGLPADASMIEFQVFFAPGWHFSRGGKFGGYQIGHGDASGYRHSDTAASHRIMWQRDGGVISYIYPPSNLRQELPELKAEGHGVGYFHDVFPAGTLKIGAWNTLRLGTKMNTFDAQGKPRADGVALLAVNGKTAVKRGVRWSRSPDLRISSFQFGTFFGGPDPAVCDCTAYYKDFKMLKYAEN